MVLAALSVMLVTVGQALIVILIVVTLPVLRSAANLALVLALVLLAVSGVCDAASGWTAEALSLRLILLSLVAEAAAAPALYLHLIWLMGVPATPRAAGHAVLPGLLAALALPLFLVETHGPDGLAGLLRTPSPAVAVAALAAGLVLVASPLLQLGYWVTAFVRLVRDGGTTDLRRRWQALLLVALGVLWLAATIARVAGTGADWSADLAAVFDLVFALALSALLWAGLALRGALQRGQAAVMNTVESALAKYRRSALTADGAAEIVRKAQQALIAGRLFADPGLTLPRLARQIGASPNDLSQAINQTLGERFNDFINARRIAEAQRLLTDPARAEQAILDIAYEVGFNAKSTFNTAFVKRVGRTPSDYRKTHRSRACCAKADRPAAPTGAEETP